MARLFHPIGPAGGAEHAPRKLVRKTMGRPAMMSAAPRNVPAYKGFSAGMLQTGRPRRHAFSIFCSPGPRSGAPCRARSEEHTSELQSLTNLVCRLLLEKKKEGFT